MASNSGVTLAKAWVTIIPTTEGAEQAITNALTPAAESAGTEAGAKGGKSLSTSMGRSLVGTGAKMTAGITTPLVGIGTAAVNVGMQFESSMQNVAALSGATGEELSTLEDTARLFGSTTKFSASQAADALGYMALAGWDVTQMTSGLPGVLNLAAASGMDLASASDMVTDYLSAFGLEAQDSAYFADMLAYAQGASNTSAQSLGEAYKNCAANLNAAGQDVETTTAMLAMMANQGLKGSEAGTALNAIMRDITSSMEDGSIMIGETAVAVTDADGNFRDLTDILADVEAATNGMGDAERAAALQSTFTADSTKGLNLLLNAGVGEAAAFEEGLRGSGGAAEEMAATMNDSLSGRMAELNSAVEECGLKLFEVLGPAITTVVENVNSAVSAFSEWWGGLSEGTQTAIIGAVGVVAALGPVLIGVGAVGSAIPGVVEAVKTFKIGFSGLSTVLRANPIGIVVTVLGTLAAALVTAYQTNEDFRAAVDSAWQAIQSAAGPIFEGIAQTVSQVWEGMSQSAASVWNGISAALDLVWNGFVGIATTAFQLVADVINGNWEGVSQTAANVWNGITSALGTVWDALSGVAGTAFEAVSTVIGGVWSGIQTAAATAWTTVTSALSSTWETIKGNASTKFEEVKSSVGTVWDNVTTEAGQKWASIQSALASTWDTVKSNAKTKFNTLKSNLSTTWQNVTTTTAQKWSAISSALTSTWETVKGNAKEKFDALKSNLGTTWGNVTTEAATKWGEISTALSSVWEGVKSTAGTKFDELKTNLGTTWDTVSTAAGTAWSGIQTALGTIWDSLSTSASTIFTGVQTTLGGIWDGISSAAATAWSGIQSAMTGPMETAKTLIDGIASGISSIIGSIDLSLPSIAMPHFVIYDWGEAPFGILGMGRMPSFGVEWYAKGGIFSDAQIIGVGEAGPEAVVPLSGRQMQPFADAIAEAMTRNGGANARPINVGTLIVREEADVRKIARELYRLEREEAMSW